MTDGQTLICDQCGVSFFRLNRNIKDTQHVFCSPLCHHVWRKEHKLYGKDAYNYRDAQIEKPCEYCGKMFLTWKKSADIHRYCSMDCKSKAQTKKIPVPCAYCGQEIMVAPHRLEWSKIRGRGNVYCNPECCAKGHRDAGGGGWIEDRSQLKDRNHSIRSSAKYKEWRRAVFERDNYTCQACNARGSVLHAHHIKPYSTNPELCFVVENGITVCRSCHRAQHPVSSSRRFDMYDIGDILGYRLDGYTLQQIADMFDVNASTISAIVHRKTYKLYCPFEMPKPLVRNE